MASSVADFFANLKNREEQKSAGSNTGSDKPVDGSLLDLCYSGTMGTSLLRPIVDVNGVPMREVNAVYDIVEKKPFIGNDGQQRFNDDGTPWTKWEHFFFMSPSNYRISLTPAQLKLHAEASKLLEEYRGLCNDELIDPFNPQFEMPTCLTARWRSEITFFWAKVMSLTVQGSGCIISDGLVRLCRHHGSTFRKDFTTAIDNKTAMNGNDGSWQEEYFTRTLGQSNCGVMMNISRTTGFTNMITFDKMGTSYEITQRDLDAAGDLFKAGDNVDKPTISGFDATVFPEERITELRNTLASYLDHYKELAAKGVSLGGAPAEQVAAPNIGVAPAQPTQAPVAQSAPAPEAAPVMPTVNMSNIQPTQAPVAQPVVQPTPVQPVAPQVIPTPVAPVTPVQPQVVVTQPMQAQQVIPPQPQVMQSPVTAPVTPQMGPGTVPVL